MSRFARSTRAYSSNKLLDRMRNGLPNETLDAANSSSRNGCSCLCSAVSIGGSHAETARRFRAYSAWESADFLRGMEVMCARVDCAESTGR
jgi:hypothetical protein